MREPKGREDRCEEESKEWDWQNLTRHVNTTRTQHGFRGFGLSIIVFESYSC